MNEPNDVPRWVRLVLGRPLTRPSAVYILMGSEMFALLAAIPVIAGLIGYILSGTPDWTASELLFLPVALALAGFAFWVWRAIHWMDRHHAWPPEETAPTARLGV